MEWYLKVIKNYATFSGRARRQEFWMFVLFNFIISIVLSIVDNAVGVKLYQDQGMFGSLYSLFVFIPGIAVSVRRLHDIGKSGWILLAFYGGIFAIFIALFAFFFSNPAAGMLSFMWIGLLLVLGLSIWLIVMYATEGDSGTNDYGKDPKGTDDFELTDHLV